MAELSTQVHDEIGRRCLRDGAGNSGKTQSSLFITANHVGRNSDARQHASKKFVAIARVARRGRCHESRALDPKQSTRRRVCVEGLESSRQRLRRKLAGAIHPLPKANDAHLSREVVKPP